MVSMPHWLYQLIIFFLIVAKAMNEEQRITVCKTGLNQIYTMLRSSPQTWRNYITLARSVIAHLDATTFMQQASRTAEQVWMIAGLQRLAYVEVDNGGVADIASWCARQWMVIFQREPQNIAALRGMYVGGNTSSPITRQRATTTQDGPNLTYLSKLEISLIGLSSLLTTIFSDRRYRSVLVVPSPTYPRPNTSNRWQFVLQWRQLATFW